MDFLSGLVTFDGAMVALIDISNLLSEITRRRTKSPPCTERKPWPRGTQST
jgi:hypothetical protein